MSCCNNIYPNCDLKRWETSYSVALANADNYYTKKEVDGLLDDIVVSGDGITADEAQDLIDSSLEDYYTKEETDAGFNTINSKLNKKVDEDHLNGIGNIEVKSRGGLNGVYIYDRAPIRGTYTNLSWESGYVNGLEMPFNDNGVVIGKFNDFNDSYISGDRVLGESYFQIGDGENLENRHNLFTIYDNGYIKTTGTDGNDVVLQDWMKESETKLSQAKSFIDEMNALAVYNNRHDGIQIPFTLYAYLLPSQPTYLKVTGTFDESVTRGYSITSLTLTPQAHNGTATEEEFGWSYPYTGTSNVILSGFTVDGYIPSGGLKTINGQTLEGSGDIQIGTGGTIDLSNYYTKSETNGLLDNKLDASAYTPTDLSGYWTSGETQEAINAATSGIPSSQTIEGFRSDLNALSDDVHTNYYTKSQVDALIATLQSKIDALEAQLEECCSGGGGEDMEGKKYLLHLTDETEHSMECNSSSTLTVDDLSFGSGAAISRTGITDVTIGDCVTEIAPMAMQYYSAITSCTISSSVTSIGYSAFDGCKVLTSLTIPTGVTSIPLYMCRDCWDLSATNIPDGVTSIGEGAYLDCLSLMNITIPSGVTSIGNNAFRTSSWTSSNPTNYQKMQNIATGRTVTILAETPPTLGDGVFDIQTGSSDIATYPIYVPANSVNAYKAAWTQYANRIFAIS